MNQEGSALDAVIAIMAQVCVNVIQASTVKLVANNQFCFNATDISIPFYQYSCPFSPYLSSLYICSTCWLVF